MAISHQGKSEIWKHNLQAQNHKHAYLKERASHHQMLLNCNGFLGVGTYVIKFVICVSGNTPTNAKLAL